MKHGPNALIDEDLPVVIIATNDDNDSGSMPRYDKTLSNLKEVKARSGCVIAIATEGDDEIQGIGRSRALMCRRRRNCCRRSWRSFHCNCWRITSPFAADATSTSRATWRSR